MHFKHFCVCVVTLNSTCNKSAPTEFFWPALHATRVTKHCTALHEDLSKNTRCSVPYSRHDRIRFCAHTHLRVVGATCHSAQIYAFLCGAASCAQQASQPAVQTTPQRQNTTLWQQQQSLGPFQGTLTTVSGQSCRDQVQISYYFLETYHTHNEQ